VPTPLHGRPYSGRHRAAPGQPSHSSRQGAGRTARRVFRPLSVSAVSLGLTFAVVQTATSLDDMTAAQAAPPAVMPTTQSSPTATADRSSGPESVVRLPAALESSTTVRDTLSVAIERASRPRPSTPPAPPTPTVDPMQVWVAPVAKAQLSSPYGPRWGTIHRGIDLAAPLGTPLLAMSGGVVTFAGQQSGYGNIVQIKYWDGTVSYYGHMNSMAVKQGDAVKPGQLVGQLGNTGQSTGPHLHLEIHPGGGADIDPAPWLKSHGLVVA